MEILDVVNEKDEVVGTAPFSDAYSKKLPHRIVHVLLFNNKGEMALQMRSRHKKFCPQHWSTAVGGHVQSGETYEQAALREYKEELGNTSSVTFAFKDHYTVPETGMQKFVSTFTSIFNSPFDVSPKEVEKVEYFSLDKINEMILKGEKFHPELLFLLKKHYSSAIKPGVYRHYKGNMYKVIGTGKHSENLSDFVVYQGIYDSPEFGKNPIWVRPKEMFFEEVEHQGKKVKRFELVKEN